MPIYSPQSTDILRRLASPSRFDQAPIGPVATSDMTEIAPGVTDVGTRMFNRDEEMANDRTTAALAGLKQAADVKRDIGVADTLGEDYDTEYRAPGRQNAIEDVKDIGSQRAMPRMDMESEGAAGREFLPNVDALHGRQRREHGEDIYGQYGYPAIVKNEADLGSAELDRQGKVEAAVRGGQAQSGTALQSAMITGLLHAAAAQLTKTGKLDPNLLQQLGGAFGRPQTAQPGTGVR